MIMILMLQEKQQMTMIIVLLIIMILMQQEQDLWILPLLLPLVMQVQLDAADLQEVLVGDYDHQKKS